MAVAVITVVALKLKFHDSIEDYIYVDDSRRRLMKSVFVKIIIMRLLAVENCNICTSAMHAYVTIVL